MKDVNSGNVGVLNERLAVPEIPDDKLDASSLILADQMEPVSAKDLGIWTIRARLDQGWRPKLNSEFSTDQPGWDLYAVFYNLSVDEKTHKNNLSVDNQSQSGRSNHHSPGHDG